MLILGRLLGIGYNRSQKKLQPSSTIISLVMGVLVEISFFGPSAANIGPIDLGIVLKDAQKNYAQNSSFRIFKFMFVIEIELFKKGLKRSIFSTLSLN